MAWTGVLVRVRSQCKTAWPAYLSTKSTASSSDSEPEYSAAKPYSEIPGPKPLPIPKFGNFWRFLPYGTFWKMDMLDMNIKLFEDYGPIVKFGGTGKYDMILLDDPDDAEKVFRAEGPWPERVGVDSVDYYRRYVRPETFQGFLGVFTTQGEEWQRNRSILNQPMMKPQNAKNYQEPIQIIADEFIKRMRDLRDEKLELPKDFNRELHKWSLESIAYIALDTRLGCLDPNLPEDSEAMTIINAAVDMFDLMFKLDMMPSLWRIYSTSNYKKMVKTLDTMSQITMKYITKKLEEIDGRQEGDPQGQSILEILLRGEGGKSAAMTMSNDMMAAGIDTKVEMLRLQRQSNEQKQPF